MTFELIMNRNWQTKRNNLIEESYIYFRIEPTYDKGA